MTGSDSARLRRLAASYRICSLGSSAESTSELERRFLALFSELLNASAAWFLVPTSDGLELSSACGISQDKLKARFERGGAAYRKLWEIATAGEIREVRRIDLFLPDSWSKRHQIYRILVFPMTLEGEIQGVQCVATSRSERLPRRDSLGQLWLEAANAWARTKAVESIKADADANRRSALRANELVRFARAIDLNDVERIWDRAIEQLPSMFSAELVTIFLYDKKSNKLVLKRGYNQDFKERIEVDLSSREEGKLMAAAIDSGGPWLIDDVSLVAEARRDRPKYRAKSCLIIPLREGSGEHKLMGVVNFTNPKKEVGFDERDLDSAAIVGELLGTKVSNALLWGELKKLAVTDSLTGLYVHRYFKEALAREVRRADRFNKHLSLLMIDVDLFKQINDSYGHPAGDTALVAIAKLLTENVRESVDVVARYGGEEFAIILLETPKDRAVEVANRVRQQVAACPLLYYLPGEGKHRVVSASTQGAQAFYATISIGLSSFPDDANTFERLIDMADAALYEGKAQGGNKVILA